MPSERDDGQMMLLAAIVLLIAFVSMAVMISRVTLVASETSRDQHGPFLREAGAVAEALTILQATRDAPGGTDAILGNQIADLQSFEAQRGFLLSWDCVAAGPDTFRLTDGRSVLTIDTFAGANAC